MFTLPEFLSLISQAKKTQRRVSASSEKLGRLDKYPFANRELFLGMCVIDAARNALAEVLNLTKSVSGKPLQAPVGVVGNRPEFGFGCFKLPRLHQGRSKVHSHLAPDALKRRNICTAV